MGVLAVMGLVVCCLNWDLWDLGDGWDYWWWFGFLRWFSGVVFVDSG